MPEKIRLKEIVSIHKGKKHSSISKYQDNAIRYLQIEDLRHDGALKYTTDKDGTLATQQDIIIAWDGANAGTVGSQLHGFVGSTLAVLKNKNPEHYDAQFIALFLQSKFDYLRSKTTGATIPHLHRKTLENLELPNFSLYKQNRLANLLSQIEALVVKREESIRLLDELLKSTFLEMFVFPKHTSHWPLKTVEDICVNMRTGPFGSALLHSEFSSEGDVAVLGIDNAVNNSFEWNKLRFITNEKYQKLKRYKIEPSDVIITIMGTLGRTAVVPSDIPLAINTKHLAALTLNSSIANPYYFAFAIQVDPRILSQLKNKTRGAIMSGLNLTIIKKLKLILPTFELQNQFALIFKQVETTKQHYQKSLTELRNLFGSLSQRAFKGELDLDNIVFEEPSVIDPVDDHVKQLWEKKKQFDALHEKVTLPVSNTLEDGTVVSGHRMDETGFEALIKELAKDGAPFEEIYNAMLYGKGWTIPYDEKQNRKEKALEYKKSVFDLLDRGELIQEFDGHTKTVILKSVR